MDSQGLSESICKNIPFKFTVLNRIEYINAVKSALEVRKDERKEIE